MYICIFLQVVVTLLVVMVACMPMKEKSDTTIAGPKTVALEAESKTADLKSSEQFYRPYFPYAGYYGYYGYYHPYYYPTLYPYAFPYWW